MALGDPQIDPMLAQQLYAEPQPDLAAPPEAPWSWMPANWGAPLAMPAIAPDVPDPSAQPFPLQPVTATPPIPAEAVAAPVELPPPVTASPAAPPSLLPLPAPQPGPAIQPEPSPDAITGADQGGADATQLLAPTLTRTEAELPEAAYRSAVAGLGDGPFWDEQGRSRLADPEHSRRYLSETALKDPVKFARITGELDDIKDQNFLAEQKRIANEHWERQQALERDRAEAMKVARRKAEALEADAQRLADTKIDPSGGITGGRRVAGVLAAIVGGLYQGATGSARNIGLDALNDAINRGIETQKAEIANKRALLGDRRNALAAEMERIGDEHEAEERVRMASYKHALDLLAIERQNYARGGTTDLKLANMQAQVVAAMQKARADKEAVDFKREVDAREQIRKEAETEAKIKNDRAQIGLGYAQLKSAAEDRRLAREQRAQEKADEMADKEAERNRQFAIGAMPTVQVGPDGKPVIGPDGKPVIVFGDLKNKDGTTWWAASAEEAKDLRTKKTSTEQLTKLYDRAIALSDRVGGETWVGNSPEYQELKAIEKEILLLKKQGTQGMSSDADMDNLVEASGARDITSFRSKIPGLKAARARTVDKFNTEMANARYTGPRLEYPETRPTDSTAEEIRIERLMRPPDVDSDALAARRHRLPSTLSRDVPDVGGSSPERLALPDDPGLSQEQRDFLSELGIAARGPANDKAAETARARLQRFAAEAQTGRLRQVAKQELESALRYGIGSDYEGGR